MPLDPSLEADILAAFDESAALAGNTLAIRGLTNLPAVNVIAAPIHDSRMLRDAGYLPSQLSSFSIKRADFKALNIMDRTDVLLDGVLLRVVQIVDDASDPILQIILSSQR
jgi:hypothetical protein